MSTHQKLAYSPAEVASALGLARSTVYAGVEAGTIPSRQVGARILVPAEWVQQFAREPVLAEPPAVVDTRFSPDIF